MKRAALVTLALLACGCEHEPNVGKWIPVLMLWTTLPVFAIGGAFILWRGVVPGVPRRMRETHGLIMGAIAAFVLGLAVACWWDFLEYTDTEKADAAIKVAS